MVLKIYNTMSRDKEEFIPLVAGKVSLYVCGMTVYDYCHLGHARSLLTFDMVHRYLKFKGYDVTFVRNFTDIDDKIIQKAQDQGIEWTEVTKKFIDAFHEDTSALGMIPASLEPRATDFIQGMIELISKLEEKGIAYQGGNDVFYAVSKFSEYGKLSGKNIEDLQAGARVDVMDVKRNPLDFALWKGSKPGEPSWPSPWGLGRPGWHIECSVMSMHHLSTTFDIHGGGRDLIFPHHENEIAQSEGATGKPFARYWMHNGFVNINSEKMSKSLGNFTTIRDVLKIYPAEVVRLFVLSAHYRSPLDYTDQNIINSASGLERYYATCLRIHEFLSQGVVKNPDDSILANLTEFENSFIESMDDDFNTARVIGLVFEWVRYFNKALDEKTLSQQVAKRFLEIMDRIALAVGLFGADPKNYLESYRSLMAGEQGLSEAEIENLIQERLEAKKEKNFKKSDEIRDMLT